MFIKYRKSWELFENFVMDEFVFWGWCDILKVVGMGGVLFVSGWSGGLFV